MKVQRIVSLRGVTRLCAAIACTLSLFARSPALAQDRPYLADSCKAGVTVECLFDEAVVLAQGLPAAAERTHRLADIAFAQVAAGRREGARRVILRMAAEAREIADPRSRAYLAVRIAELYRRLDDPGAARDTLRSESRAAKAIADGDARLSVWHIVGTEQAQRGDLEGARATAGEFRSAVESIADADKRGALFESFAGTLILTDGPAEAERIRDPFRRALALANASRHLRHSDRENVENAALSRADQLPPQAELQRMTVVRAIFRNRVAAGDLAGARRLTVRISEEAHLRMGRYGAWQLAVAMAEAGDVGRALAIAHRLPADDAARVFAAISSQLVREGDIGGALRMAERASTREQVRLYCELGKAQKSQPAAAAAVLIKAERAANDHPLLRFEGLAAVARTYAEIGDSDNGRSLVVKYLDESRKFYKLYVWVEPLLAAKDRDAALRVALELLEDAKRDAAKPGPHPALRGELRRAAEGLGLAGDLGATRDAAWRIDSNGLKASALAWAALRFVEGARLRD